MREPDQPLLVNLLFPYRRDGAGGGRELQEVGNICIPVTDLC